MAKHMHGNDWKKLGTQLLTGGTLHREDWLNVFNIVGEDTNPQKKHFLPAYHGITDGFKASGLSISGPEGTFHFTTLPKETYFKPKDSEKISFNQKGDFPVNATYRAFVFLIESIQPKDPAQAEEVNAIKKALLEKYGEQTMQKGKKNALPTAEDVKKVIAGKHAEFSQVTTTYTSTPVAQPFTREKNQEIAASLGFQGQAGGGAVDAWLLNNPGKILEYRERRQKVDPSYRLNTALEQALNRYLTRQETVQDPLSVPFSQMHLQPTVQPVPQQGAPIHYISMPPQQQPVYTSTPVPQQQPVYYTSTALPPQQQPVYPTPFPPYGYQQGSAPSFPPYGGYYPQVPFSPQPSFPPQQPPQGGYFQTMVGGPQGNVPFTTAVQRPDPQREAIILAICEKTEKDLDVCRHTLDEKQAQGLPLRKQVSQTIHSLMNGQWHGPTCDRIANNIIQNSQQHSHG